MRTNHGNLTFDDVNAYDVGYQMVVDMCHHEVVLRSTMFWIPLFGKRCGSFLNLIAVAGNIVVVQYFIKEFALMVFP